MNTKSLNEVSSIVRNLFESKGYVLEEKSQLESVPESERMSVLSAEGLVLAHIKLVISKYFDEEMYFVNVFQNTGDELRLLPLLDELWQDYKIGYSLF